LQFISGAGYSRRSVVPEPLSIHQEDQPNACIPHQRGSRFSGQRWRRAVRESAAGADQSLPPSCQSHASVRGGLAAGCWRFGLISVFAVACARLKKTTEFQLRLSWLFA
jgi:hypothetical protein